MRRLLAALALVVCGVVHAQVSVKSANPNGTSCGSTTQGQIIKESGGGNLVCTCWSDQIWHCTSGGGAPSSLSNDQSLLWNNTGTIDDTPGIVTYNPTTEITKIHSTPASMADYDDNTVCRFEVCQADGTCLLRACPVDQSDPYQTVLRVGERAQSVGDSRTLVLASESYTDMPTCNTAGCEGQALYGINEYKSTNDMGGPYMGVNGVSTVWPQDSTSHFDGGIGTDGFVRAVFQDCTGDDCGDVDYVFGTAGNANAQSYTTATNGHVGKVHGAHDTAIAVDMPTPADAGFTSGVYQLHAEDASTYCEDSTILSDYSGWFLEPSIGTGCTANHYGALGIARNLTKHCVGGADAGEDCGSGATCASTVCSLSDTTYIGFGDANVNWSRFGFDYTDGKMFIRNGINQSSFTTYVALKFLNDGASPYSWQLGNDPSSDQFFVGDLTSDDAVLYFGKSLSGSTSQPDGSLGLNVAAGSAIEFTVKRNSWSARTGSMFRLEDNVGGVPQIEFADSVGTAQLWKMGGNDTNFYLTNSTGGTNPFTITRSTGIPNFVALPSCNAVATGASGNMFCTTMGAGLAGTSGTMSTDSTEQNFLASGALTCGASTNGKIKVHTTPLQYCDNAATPALQYAAYGSSTGVATSATALAANGTNCSAGSYPLGVDASGNAESCTVATAGSVSKTSQAYTTATSLTIATASLTRGLVNCYDGSDNAVEPDSVNWNTSTGDVTVTFFSARTGTCVAVY